MRRSLPAALALVFALSVAAASAAQAQAGPDAPDAFDASHAVHGFDGLGGVEAAAPPLPGPGGPAGAPGAMRDPVGTGGRLDVDFCRTSLDMTMGLPLPRPPDFGCGPDPDDLERILGGDEGPAPEGNATTPENATSLAEPEPGPPAATAIADEEPLAWPPPTPQEPLPPAPGAGGDGQPAPSSRLAPAPAAAPGGWTQELLLWSAAAAAVGSSLALKLASLLLALRRRKESGSPVRAEVLALLAQEPGMHHMELVRRVGKGNGTVEHHLHALVRDGKVRRLRTSGYTCYFPAQGAGAAASLDARLAAARASLRGRTSRRLVAALAAAGPGGPPRSLSELAAALGVAASTAHYHAGRLAAAGVLADARSGARRGLALTDLGRAVAPAPASAPAPQPMAMPSASPSPAPGEPSVA